MRIGSNGSRGWRTVLLSTALAAPLGLAIDTTPAAAHMPKNLPLATCASSLSGTYLNTITVPPSGDFLLRSLATFTPSGSVFVVESAEGGNLVGPYSDAQGTWACVAADQNTVTVKFTVLDFTYGASQFIARVDYEITVDKAQKNLTGTLEVRVYPLTADPIPTPATPPIGTYNITGQRVLPNG